MHEFLHTNAILHAIYHSLLVLPLLYFAYVLLELIEHKASDSFKAALQEDRRMGPIAGAIIGLIPLCGFSDLGVGLYTGKVISLGTLVALFISTSGETLLLATSYPNKLLAFIFLLLVKLCIAGLAGFIIDLCLRHQPDIHIQELCDNDHCECGHSSIWRSALNHTLPVFSLILSFNLFIGLLEIFGVINLLKVLIEAMPILGVLLSALIGFIPGCAPMVMLLGLWNSGVLSSAALLAGLITSTGTGMLVLYKVNKNVKQNLLITAAMFIIAIGMGFLFEITGLFTTVGV